MSQSSGFRYLPDSEGVHGEKDAKRILASPIPQNRVEVAMQKSPEDCPPVNMGQCGQESGPHRMDSQSQDRPLVLSMGNDIENGVKKE